MIKIYTARRTLGTREQEAWGPHNLGMAEYHDRNFIRAAGYFRDALKAAARRRACRDVPGALRAIPEDPAPGELDRGRSAEGIMSIRFKIVLIVVPLIVATLPLTGVSSYFSASNGITRIAKDFLGFKSQELQTQAESQWRLLVDNNLTGKPEMVAATQAAVEGYARSIVRSATELILAVGRDGDGADEHRATSPCSPGEQQRMAGLGGREEHGPGDGERSGARTGWPRGSGSSRSGGTCS